MRREVEGLKRRIWRSLLPVRRYWPLPAEKVRAWTGLLWSVRRAMGVVGKDITFCLLSGEVLEGGRWDEVESHVTAPG